MGEPSSEVSNFIPDTRNFSEVTKLLDDINNPWLKANNIKNIINNQTFIVQDPEKGDPVTPCMDVYKAEIQSHGSLDKLKLIILVRGDLQNTELFGDNW